MTIHNTRSRGVQRRKEIPEVRKEGGGDKDGKYVDGKKRQQREYTEGEQIKGSKKREIKRRRMHVWSRH